MCAVSACRIESRGAHGCEDQQISGIIWPSSHFSLNLDHFVVKVKQPMPQFKFASEDFSSEHLWNNLPALVIIARHFARCEANGFFIFLPLCLSVQSVSWPTAWPAAVHSLLPSAASVRSWQKCATLFSSPRRSPASSPSKSSSSTNGSDTYTHSENVTYGA